MVEWGVCMRCPNVIIIKRVLLIAVKLKTEILSDDVENAKIVMRFTTFERVEELPLLVIKKDGTEQFSREKF